MFCPKCGKLNVETAEFCKNCGRKLGSKVKAEKEEPKTEAPAKAEVHEKEGRPVPVVERSKRKVVFFVILILLAVLAAAGYYFVFRPLRLQVSPPAVRTPPSSASAPQGSSPQTAAPASKEKIARITASSVLTDSYGVYSPENVVDNDIKTAWCESANGAGEGEWIEIDFTELVHLEGLGAFPGYGETEKKYFLNNRVKRLDIEFSNHQSAWADMNDSYSDGMRQFFIQPVDTTYVKFIIKEVYPGTKYNDTCISEVNFGE